MKIIFAGTSEFAIPALIALMHSQHEICAIYTKPDRPAGRGQKLTASPIKTLAIANSLSIYQPTTLKDPASQQLLYSLSADILINVAYGMILPEEILNAFKFGCINIHPSLLPRWRGAAPIQRAIMAHDNITGVSIMQMDTGLDTGGIYKQMVFPIENTDTTAILLTKTAEIGATLLLEVLTEIETGKAKITSQNNEHSTYANKIVKTEGNINWHKSAQEIDCMIRAFNPWPIAYTEAASLTIRIWQAQILEAPHYSTKNTLEPGTTIQANKHGIDVMTGNGMLRLIKIQLPGGKPLLAADLLNAHHDIFVVGKKL